MGSIRQYIKRNVVRDMGKGGASVARKMRKNVTGVLVS